MKSGVQAISLEHLYHISHLINRSVELRPVLNEVTSFLRKILIFDNLVIYLLDSKNNYDAYYGRALGRGRSAEADAAWGEKLAGQVIENREQIIQAPPLNHNSNRLDSPYLLGIPLIYSNVCLGAFILIRFGGPPFSPSDCELATFVVEQLSFLINRQSLDKEFSLLQGEQKQIKIREDFFSNISHELRTPLGCIKGYSTTLLRNDTTWDKSTEREFLQIIEKEADYLQQLIDNLIDSTRMSSGMLRMKFQNIRLDMVVKDSIERTLLRFPETVIKLETSDQLRVVEGDPNRLNQVFENIFNNAIKYAPESEIWVKIKQENQSIMVSIQDFGPGISEKYLPHIFDRFFRNPELLPNVHGSGLGLYICEQLVQAHHGRIEAVSKIGEGTIFTIVLPEKQVQQGQTTGSFQEETT
jgi:K+-sensing histidine kinase KdpD